MRSEGKFLISFYASFNFINSPIKLLEKINIIIEYLVPVIIYIIILLLYFIQLWSLGKIFLSNLSEWMASVKEGKRKSTGKSAKHTALLKELFR